MRRLQSMHLRATQVQAPNMNWPKLGGRFGQAAGLVGLWRARAFLYVVVQLLDRDAVDVDGFLPKRFGAP